MVLPVPVTVMPVEEKYPRSTSLVLKITLPSTPGAFIVKYAFDPPPLIMFVESLIPTVKVFVNTPVPVTVRPEAVAESIVVPAVNGFPSLAVDTRRTKSPNAV